MEIKRSSALAVSKGFHLACDDVTATRRIVVGSANALFRMAGGIEDVPLLGLMHEMLALRTQQPGKQALSLWTYPQSHQKSRHHVVGGNCRGQLNDLGGVEVRFDLFEHIVGYFHVQRHLCSILNYYAFNSC